ncbi:MAG: trigger factor, partial [candidate division WOR-3 bacterium]
MEIKVLEPEQWLRELEILVEPERVKQKIAEITKIYAQTIKVPGFRKGKVPIAVLEKRYGQQLETQALQQLFEEIYKEAIATQQLKPFTTAKITDYNLSEDKKLTLRISFEVIPDYELKEYKGIRLKKQEPTGFDQEFERRFKQLLDRCATFVSLPRPAESGDYLLCDYGVYEDDKLIGKLAQNILIQIGDAMNLKEINQGLVGVKAGETRTITVDFPQDYPDKSIAGKTRI